MGKQARRERLTAKFMASKGAQPSDHLYDVNDTLLSGFLVRIRPSGRRVYFLRYRNSEGRCKMVKIGDAEVMEPAMARATAKRLLGEIATGADPATEKRAAKAEGLTLDAFLDQYAEHVTGRNAKTAIQQIRASFKPLLTKPLADIRGMWIENWRRQRLKAGAKPGGVNRPVAYLRAALSKAIVWGLLETHPLKHVKQIKEDRGTTPRYLAPEEETRLMDALDAREESARARRDRFNVWRRERGKAPFPDLRDLAFTDHLKPLILLGLHTGARRGELLSLTWGDVELRGPTPRIDLSGYKTKSGTTRHVPLNAVALDTLRQWKAQGRGTGLVFPGKDGEPMADVNSSWQRLRKDARLPTARFHDLRHTFASKLVQRGVNLNVVRELLGHSDFKLTQRYSHLAPEQRQAAVSVLEGDPAGNVVPFTTATGEGQ